MTLFFLIYTPLTGYRKEDATGDSLVTELKKIMFQTSVEDLELCTPILALIFYKVSNPLRSSVAGWTDPAIPN
jgi:hypothetical protein